MKHGKISPFIYSTKFDFIKEKVNRVSLISKWKIFKVKYVPNITNM